MGSGSGDEKWKKLSIVMDEMSAASFADKK